MPAAPLIRYPLDPTGENPDNLVSGEVKSLSVAQIRAAAPTYGPFFTESLIVYDHGNNRLLQRGVDYQCVEMLQEATLRFGKEIAQLVLVLNPNVTSQIRLTYQTLGGLYQNNTDGLIQMYETVIGDARPVDWTNVLNKPTQYTPTLHRHYLEDVVGFEPVVVALERIRNAIVLSDVPAFEAVLDWVKNQGLTIAELNSGTGLGKFVTFEALLEAMKTMNFNAITTSPVIKQVAAGDNKVVSVSTTNMDNGTVLYWTIVHQGTSDADFATTGGVINVNNNRGTFNFTVLANVEQAVNKFDVAIRKGSPTGPIIAKLEGIQLLYNGVPNPDPGPGGENSTMQLLMACCLHDPGIKVSAKSYYLLGDS